MKKFLLSLFLIFSIVQCASAMTYDEAMQLPKNTVIMFKMQYCGACKSYEPQFDKISKKYSGKYNFVKEDVNSSQLATSLGIQSVPVIFIVYPQEKRIQKVDQNIIWQPNGLESVLK